MVAARATSSASSSAAMRLALYIREQVGGRLAQRARRVTARDHARNPEARNELGFVGDQRAASLRAPRRARDAAPDLAALGNHGREQFSGTMLDVLDAVDRAAEPARAEADPSLGDRGLR